MISKVLVVDDDQSLCRLMEKELEPYAGIFAVITVVDGQKALSILAEQEISLVLCDLRMPGIDGFELINRILKQYPHIPVMAMTAHDRPKTREVVMKSGAVDYVTKPAESAVLSKRIIKILNKLTEGGSLNRVSLGTYLQLVELEEQTCTLRIRSFSGTRQGVLFFRKGQLMDARIGSRHGREASYEILSWSNVSLAIENDCVITEKQIEGELQAILLDAMRSKDESVDSVAETDAGVPTGTPENQAISFEKVVPEPVGSLSIVQQVEQKLLSVIVRKDEIKDVYIDSRRNGVIQVETLGQVFGAGALNVIYVNKEEDQILVVPGEENVVVVLDRNTPRENAIAVFA